MDQEYPHVSQCFLLHRSGASLRLFPNDAPSIALLRGVGSGLNRRIKIDSSNRIISHCKRDTCFRRVTAQSRLIGCQTGSSTVNIAPTRRLSLVSMRRFEIIPRENHSRRGKGDFKKWRSWTLNSEKDRQGHTHNLLGSCRNHTSPSLHSSIHLPAYTYQHTHTSIYTSSHTDTPLHDRLYDVLDFVNRKFARRKVSISIKCKGF